MPIRVTVTRSGCAAASAANRACRSSTSGKPSRSGTSRTEVEDGRAASMRRPTSRRSARSTGLPATAGSFAILSLVTYEYLSKKVGTIGKSSQDRLLRLRVVPVRLVLGPGGVGLREQRVDVVGLVVAGARGAAAGRGEQRAERVLLADVQRAPVAEVRAGDGLVGELRVVGRPVGGGLRLGVDARGSAGSGWRTPRTASRGRCRPGRRASWCRRTRRRSARSFFAAAGSNSQASPQMPSWRAGHRRRGQRGGRVVQAAVDRRVDLVAVDRHRDRAAHVGVGVRGRPTAGTRGSRCRGRRRSAGGRRSRPSRSSSCRSAGTARRRCRPGRRCTRCSCRSSCGR